MSRATFMELVEALRGCMEHHVTGMRSPISVEKRVAAALWYLASPHYFRNVAQQFDLGVSTVGEIVLEFCFAMESELYSKVVCLGDWLGESMDGFGGLASRTALQPWMGPTFPLEHLRAASRSMGTGRTFALFFSKELWTTLGVTCEDGICAKSKHRGRGRTGRGGGGPSTSARATTEPLLARITALEVAMERNKQELQTMQAAVADLRVTLETQKQSDEEALKAKEEKEREDASWKRKARVTIRRINRQLQELRGVREGVLSNLSSITDLGGFDPVWLFLVVGGVMFVLGFAGCIGALRENTFLLKFFSVFLGLIFFLELTAGILAFIFKDWIKDQLNFFINNNVKAYRDDIDLQNLIDFAQEYWSCCGAHGPNDWNFNIYFNCTDSNPSRERCGVPFSCCVKDPAEDVLNTQCGYDVRLKLELEQQTFIHTKGCAVQFEKWLQDNLIVVAGTFVGIALLQIFGICLAQNLVSDINAVKANW
ncbi:tetraspanin-17 isoform X2 [Paroedura picta]|uniref:tetraspanin-17 isoform X2 n=1 Tax=Paroedura picta TaxID=143630 RepID=UPI0040570D57